MYPVNAIQTSDSYTEETLNSFSGSSSTTAISTVTRHGVIQILPSCLQESSKKAGKKLSIQDEHTRKDIKNLKKIKKLAIENNFLAKNIYNLHTEFNNLKTSLLEIIDLERKHDSGTVIVNTTINLEMPALPLLERTQGVAQILPTTKISVEEEKRKREQENAKLREYIKIIINKNDEIYNLIIKKQHQLIRQDVSNLISNDLVYNTK